MRWRVTFLIRSSVTSEAQSFHDEYPIAGVRAMPFSKAAASAGKSVKVKRRTNGLCMKLKTIITR